MSIICGRHPFLNTLDLPSSYVKLGEVALEASEKQAHYRKAEQLWIELTEAFPEYAQFQSFLGIIRERLAKF
jgi:hypothetical protein